MRYELRSVMLTLLLIVIISSLTGCAVSRYLASTPPFSVILATGGTKSGVFVGATNDSTGSLP
jgi:hypothetical protein